MTPRRRPQGETPSRRQVLSGLATVGVAGLAGCLDYFGGPPDDEMEFAPGDDADWPAPRLSAWNTAYNPDAAAPHADPVERWAVDVGMPAGAPAIVDGTVYVPTAGGLLALDAESGEKRWTYAPEERPWPTAPVVADGRLFVGLRDADSLHTLDPATGETRWRADLFGAVATFAADEWGSLYVGTAVGSGALVAVGDDGNGTVVAIEERA